MTDVDIIDQYPPDQESDTDFEGEQYNKMPSGLYLNPRPVRIVPSDRISFATYSIPISTQVAPQKPLQVVTRKEDGVGCQVRFNRIDIMASGTTHVYLFTKPEDFSIQLTALPDCFCPFGMMIPGTQFGAGVVMPVMFTTREELWIAAIDLAVTANAVVSVAVEWFDVD